MYWESIEFKKYVEFRFNGGWTTGNKPAGPYWDVWQRAIRNTQMAFKNWKEWK